jgi:predicted acyltransferase
MASTAAPQERLLSLDVFRGLTIGGMMIVNNQGGPESYLQLEHADWHGWTYTDTIFPSFLWIVGVALTLSTAKRVERGDNRQTLLLHALRRGALIFAIGLLMNGFPTFQFAHYRIPGVLQRIGICYFAATAVFLYTKMRGQIISTAFCLITYWLLMFYYPVPGVGAGQFGKEGNFERYIDTMVLTGHMYSRTQFWDPEGIVSTLPSIATVLFGALTGQILRRSHNHSERVARVFLSGNGLIFAGMILSAWMPINKNLWTVPFAVFMAGISSVVFASCYWVCDAKGYRWWAKPLEIYGMNAIAAYIAAGALARLLGTIKLDGDVSLHKVLFDRVFAPLASPVNASLLYSIAFDLTIFAFAYLLYRKRWFLKLGAGFRKS